MDADPTMLNTTSHLLPQFAHGTHTHVYHKATTSYSALRPSQAYVAHRRRRWWCFHPTCGPSPAQVVQHPPPTCPLPPTRYKTVSGTPQSKVSEVIPRSRFGHGCQKLCLDARPRRAPGSVSWESSVEEQAYLKNLALSRKTWLAALVMATRDSFASCTHLCYHDILLFFRTLCKDGALQRRRQTHPNEVTANHLAVCRGYTDTERDQMSGDGFDDPAIATTVSRLECVIHVTLQLSRLDDLSHKAGGQLAWAAARPAATSVYISVLQASRDAQKTEARVGGWIWSG